MKKRLLVTYILGISLFFIFFSSFAAYQIFRLGYGDGLYSVLLGWTLYVLAIPAAHGRFAIGAPIRFFLKQSVFIETYVWILALTINIATMFLYPLIYEKSISAQLLYRLLTAPDYRFLLGLGIVGSWYRTILGAARYQHNKSLHTFIRHLVFVVGVAIFCISVYQDFIIMLNITANG